MFVAPEGNPIRGFLILVCFVGGLADTDQVPVYVPSSRGTAKWCVLQFADSTNLLYWWLHILCLQRYVQLKQFFAPPLSFPPLCRVFGWLQHTSWNSRATIP